MMKKWSFALALLLLAGFVLAGCQNTQSPAGQSQAPAAQTSDASGNPGDSGQAAGSGKKVVLLIAGTLGDKSFFDAANSGLQMAKEQLGAEIKVIEMGTDKTKYEPTFRDVCAQDWDLIISGNPDMTDIFNQFCGEYPDKAFMNYDAADDTVMENMYSVAYKANELSYLSGVVAALATTSDMQFANPDVKIGFIGGMDDPGINDFLVGYIQGAVDMNPDIKVTVSYAQDYANPGKGKEIAINQYDAGVDVIFSVAGGTGLGAMDAASEKSLYAIGVDSDQAILFKDSDEKKAGLIITSAIKRIDQVVFNAVKMLGEGTLPLGEYQMIGFKEEGVGIAKNEFYQAAVTEEIKAKVEEIEQKLFNGEIEVKTAIGMSTEELNEIRGSVAP